MKKRDSSRLRPTALLLLLLPLALAAAAPRHSAAQAPAVAHEEHAARFDAAVKDAEVARPEEVRHTLTPVVGSNGGLVWERAGGRGRVLAATWVNDAKAAAYAERLVSGAGAVLLHDEVWVTLVPEGRRYPLDARLTGDELTRRLEQLLGLPASAVGAAWRKVKFVEFWVAPEDMFRPCPDPEIGDRECGIYFPLSPPVSRRHRDWFFEKLKSSYAGQVRFPWTRLGYTYDWADPHERRDPRDNMGLSEFVVRPGARVTVNCVEATERYLKEGCAVTSEYEQNKNRNRRRGLHRRRPRRPARAG